MKFQYIIFIFLLITSCTDKVDKNNIPGQYIFAHLNQDTIDINSDGTYRHHSFKNGQTLENSGRWSLNSSGSEITFESFTFMADKSQMGNWISKIKLEGKEIQLIYSSDSNDSYYKKMTN